jgi:hypothetical protein
MRRFGQAVLGLLIMGAVIAGAPAPPGPKEKPLPLTPGKEKVRETNRESARQNVKI